MAEMGDESNTETNIAKAVLNTNAQVSSSWIFAEFSEFELNAYNLETLHSVRLPAFSGAKNSASTILNRKLYFIGGKTALDAWADSKVVNQFDAESFKWEIRCTSTHTSRVGAVAASAEGKVYVFGGCKRHSQTNLPWAEGYNPITRKWRMIKNPSATEVVNFDIAKTVKDCIVFGEHILIRNFDGQGIAFHFRTSTWSSIPRSVLKVFCSPTSTSVAEVAGFLISYCQTEGVVPSSTLMAFDQQEEEEMWLPIQGPQVKFLEDPTWDLVNLNGHLLLYRMNQDSGGYSLTMTAFKFIERRERMWVEFKAEKTHTFYPPSNSSTLSRPLLAAAAAAAPNA